MTAPGNPFLPGVIVQRIITEVGGPSSERRSSVWSERAVLSAWLHMGRRPVVTRRLESDDFGHPWHRQLFDLLCELDAEPTDVTVLSVHQWLIDNNVTDSEKHLDLVEMWADHGPGDPQWHADRLLETSRQRVELALSQAIAKNPADTDQSHQAYRDRIADIERRAAIGVATNYGDHLQRFALRLAKGTPPAIPTGYWDLDRLTGGMRPGGVTVVGAAPGTGKSLLAVTVTAHLCSGRLARVGFISLEMSADQVNNRIVADVAQIPVDKLEQGGSKLSQGEWAAFAEAHEQMADWELDVVDGAHDTRAIRAFAEKLAAQGGRTVLILDFLQRVQEPAGQASRERHVAQVSNTLKDIAVDLDMAVIAVASLSREPARRGGRPKMSDLRDSGSIESDADVVLLLWQDAEDGPGSSIVKGTVDKNRYGQTGDTDFQRIGEFGRLDNIGHPLAHQFRRREAAA